MSSANEPYKSRLLNFLNRQTIRFQDKAGVALRNLRSTTEMGTQILLYPFYLMVQSGRATRQQLESKVQSSLLLSEAQTSPSDSEDSNPELENSSNLQEQKALSQYIVPNKKKPNLIVSTTQKVLASLPQISKRNSVNSETVKVFWQMLDWLQTSPVAKKVNLFGESKLVSSAPKLPTNRTKIPLPNLFVSLDNKVADLKTKSFLSTSRVGKYLSVRSPSANIQTDLTQSSPELTSNPFQIRAIIKAALEHFFGTNSSGQNKQIEGGDQFNLPHSAQSIPLESKTASTYLSGKSPDLNLPPAEEQESWLSWDDIFSNTITSTVKPLSLEHQTNSPQIQNSPQLDLVSLDKAENVGNITYFGTPNNQLETDPNLLETKATMIGYEKHLLERILEIIDQIFVWIEANLLKIWRVFKFKSLH